MSGPGLRARVTKEVAEVIATRRVGAYQHLTLVAPTVAELAQEPTSAVLLSLSPRVPTGPTGGDGPGSTGAMPAADS